jgi:VanZ family protein
VFILAASLLYGIIIELLQGYLTVSRRPDLFDVLANFGGALIGVFIFQKIKHLFAP